MELNQYQITFVVDGVSIEPVLIKAKDKESAWGKFVTQRFGALKPSKADWAVRLIGAVTA